MAEKKQETENRAQEEAQTASLPDEVRLRMAETELFQALAQIFQKYYLPESLSVLVMKSVMLDLLTGQLKVAAMASAVQLDEK